MKTSDRFNRRIGELVDTYQGAVPLSRCILEAARLEFDPLPILAVCRDEFGAHTLEITFEDGSIVTLSVDEEM